MTTNRGPEAGGTTPSAETPPAAPATPVAATPETPAAPAAPAAPATPDTPPPAPAEPERPTSRPWWRNFTIRREQRRNLPEEDEGPLEREENYSRGEQINQLVESIRNGSWEEHDRSRIFEERYGRNTIITRWKAWLAGEQDVTYDEASGQVVFDYQTEIRRRLANTAINVAQTGALMAAFGMLTGGTAAVALGPSLIGSAIGRATAETYQGVSGGERTRREKLIIARERYYKKAYEIASRVGREQPDFYDRNGVDIPWDDTKPEERASYEAQRNAAVRNLVNFVHASEQNSVVFRQRRTEDGGSAYFNDTSADRVSGQPLEAGGRAQGEPSEGGNAGPALNDGTEVYQPNVDAPDATRLAEMEKEFAEFRKKADTMKAIFSAVGGLAGGTFQVLAAQKAQFVQMWARLSEGGTVRLNLDGNMIWHAVQQSPDTLAKGFDGASNMVYHLNSQLEGLRAIVKGATILPGMSEFGSHALNTSLGQLVEAVNTQAWLEAARTGAAIIGGLGAHALWKRANIKGDIDRFTAMRETFENDEEMLRRGGVPEERAIPIEELARQNNKPMPEVGQTWRRRFPDSEDGYEYLEILDVDERPDRVILTVEIERPGEPDNLVDRMSAERLLENPNPDDPDNPDQGWRNVERRNRQIRPVATPAALAPGGVGGGAPRLATGGPAPVVPEATPGGDDENEDLLADAEEDMRNDQDQPLPEDETGNEDEKSAQEEAQNEARVRVGEKYPATEIGAANKEEYENATGRTFSDNIRVATVNGKKVFLRFSGEVPAGADQEIVVEKIESVNPRRSEVDSDLTVKIAEPEAATESPEPTETSVEPDPRLEAKAVFGQMIQTGAEWRAVQTKNLPEKIKVVVVKTGAKDEIAIFADTVFEIIKFNPDAKEGLNSKVQIRAKGVDGAPVVEIPFRTLFRTLTPEGIEKIVRGKKAKKQAALRTDLRDEMISYINENIAGKKVGEPKEEPPEKPSAEPETLISTAKVEAPAETEDPLIDALTADNIDVVAEGTQPPVAETVSQAAPAASAPVREPEGVAAEDPNAEDLVVPTATPVVGTSVPAPESPSELEPTATASAEPENSTAVQEGVTAESPTAPESQVNEPWVEVPEVTYRDSEGENILIQPGMSILNRQGKKTSILAIEKSGDKFRLITNFNPKSGVTSKTLINSAEGLSINA